MIILFSGFNGALLCGTPISREEESPVVCDVTPVTVVPCTRPRLSINVCSEKRPEIRGLAAIPRCLEHANRPRHPGLAAVPRDVSKVLSPFANARI